MTTESSLSAEGSGDEQQPQSGGHSSGATTQSESDQGPTQPDGLPKDVLFGLLSAQRRRRVLQYIADHGEETTLSDLADHIAALENETEIRLLSSQQRKRVYVALYQCHLPKMDDADVIDFDHSRGTVVLRPEAQELYAYLELDPIQPDEDPASTDAPDSVTDGVVSKKLASLLSR